MKASMRDLIKLQCTGVNARYCAYVMEIYGVSMHKSKGVRRHMNMREWNFNVHELKEPLQLRHLNGGFNVCNGLNRL